MNLAALSLVLVAAVLHAGWNLAAKRVRHGGATFVWAYYTASLALLLPAVIVALITEDSRPRWTWLLAALVTAVLHIAYGVVLQRGYDAGELSVVYPMARGVGPLLSIMLAVILLGERPGPVGLLGAALIIAGVLVIGSGSGRVAASRRSLRAGIAYGAAIGAVIAAYTLWDAYSVTELGIPPVIYFGTAAVMQSAILTPHALSNRGQLSLLWRQHRREVLIISVLSPLAYLLVLFALRLAPVSLVAPAREVSIVLSGLAAWLILGETNARRRLIGSIVVLGGIVAIALA